MKYTLNDVFIVPARVSLINSRSECNPYYKDGMLPLFTAPMSSVVDSKNYRLFLENKINPIIPRNIPLKDRINLCKKVWCAFGLDEFIDFTNKTKVDEIQKAYLLIDIANGHMIKLHDAIRDAKEKFGDKIIIMAGNIANPETYKALSEAGADFIRLGIGGGSACFVDGTKVKTLDGNEISIEDINLNTEVLTHKGNGKVTNVIRYTNTDMSILNINDEIKCTENHEFYVVNLSDSDKINDDNIHEYAYWVKANKLDKNIHLLIKLLE